MMPVKRTIIFAAAFILGTLLYSQNNGASIHFETEQFNLGKINEADGSRTHDFKFTNKGQEPLLVVNVVPARGLVVVDWTKSPVLPGSSGIITVEFNPLNMTGLFNRSITIHTNGNPSSQIVRLLGEVMPREKTPQELFPQEIGLLRLRTNHIPFGQVFAGSHKDQSLEIINISDGNLTVSFANIPESMTISAVPETLGPGEKGIINATFNAGMINDWGMVNHNFRVLVNGLAPQRNIIYVSANIQEDYSKMSREELDNAPVISFENRVFDFGQLKHGASIEHDFIFTNSGKSDLVIRRVISGCGCTAIKPSLTVLKPGESSSIKAVFNSKGFRGRQNKGITVISNDPGNQNIGLRITGEVVE
jgi:hypothetical protein